MPNPKALPSAAPVKLSVWADQSGTPYLVQQQPDGSTTLHPLETHWRKHNRLLSA
jgi:hypothetical protein